MFERLFQPNVGKLKTRGDIDGLIDALTASSAEVQLDAARALAALPDPDATRALIEALDRGVALAATALGMRGDRAAVSVLCSALSSRENEIHRSARAALVALSATDALRNILRSGDSQVRRLALDALLELQPSDLPTLLTGALTDPDESVRALAEQAGAIPDEREATDPALRLSATRALAHRSSTADRARLLTAAVDPSPPVRAAAVEGLGRIGAELTVFTRALRDPDPTVRATAAWALGAVRAGRAAVEAALADPDARVRQEAALALGRIGDPLSLPALFEALRDDNWAAARALGQIGDADAVPPLIAALDRPLLAALAAEALGVLGDAEALPALERLIRTARRPTTLRSEEPDAADFAREAISRIRARNASPLRP